MKKDIARWFQRSSLGGLALLLSLTWSVAAKAKIHYKNQLMGGRAATMGGAYTAVADDASGAYYNPAGLVYVQGLSLSGSANMFAFNKYTYEQTVGNQNWERESENLNPSYFGLAKKIGPWAFSLGYALEDTVKENQNQVFENLNTGAGTMSYYSLIMNTEDDHYLLGASLAYEVDRELSLGLTLNYSYRKFQRLQNQYIKYANADVEHAFDFKEIKAKGAKPQLGLMWSPAERWSLGLSVAKNLILSQITEEVRNKEEKASVTNDFMRSTHLTKDKTPTEILAGVAFFASPEWLFAVNLDTYLESDAGKTNVYNLSLGMEHFLTPVHALRAGLYTNRTNVKEYNTTTRNVDERIHLYGMTLGYGHYSKNNEITFGTIYSMGSGKVQPYTGSTSIRNVKYHELKLLLASSYTF